MIGVASGANTKTAIYVKLAPLTGHTPSKRMSKKISKAAIMSICVPLQQNFPSWMYVVLPSAVVVNPRRHAQSGLQQFCMYVCLSAHAILAVREIRSITKDAIVLSVRFAAISKWRFS